MVWIHDEHVLWYSRVHGTRSKLLFSACVDAQVLISANRSCLTRNTAALLTGGHLAF